MKRKIYDELLKEKNSRKISIVIGPRQVGKTTILKQLYEELGGFYVDLDILENVEKFETYRNVINSLTLAGYNEKKKFYLFLDEFHKYKDITKILKNIYDHHENIKIYATGSSSIKIKDKIQESLAGRKFLHKLYSLDFEEFLMFKNIKKGRLDKLRKFQGELPTYEYKEEIEEYMLYGGYPEVVLNEHKQKILASIFDTYVKKDLVDYLNVKEILGVKKLIQLLAINNGNKVNISKVSEKLGMKREKIESYLEVLEEIFLIKKIRPFFSNKNKEIVKTYKLYFIDSGVRNYFCNNFNKLSLRNDTGFLFKTFVLSEMIKNSKYEIKFWQNKQKHEVDFVIDKIYEQIGLEVKFKGVLKKRDYLGIKHIGNKIKCYLVNLKKQDEKHLLPFSIKNIL